MSPAEVDTALAVLRVTNPGIHCLYRDGETLSDDDRRAILEDATKLIEDKE